RPGSPKGGGLHRLLRDCVRHERAAGARDRRRRDGGAGGRRGEAGARRGVRPLRMDSARLLRLYRARLRTGDADVLRPGTSVGERGENRSRQSLVTSLTSVADALLSVVLAPACAACDEPLDHPTQGPVCGRCWRSILPLTPPICARCGDPLPTWREISVPLACCPRCRRRERFVDRARAIGAYDGALRAIIHALKYDGRRSLARTLG